LDEFTTIFYQNFKKELTQILPKLFHKIEREGMRPNSFYKASSTLKPKPVRAHKNIKLQRDFLDEHGCKFFFLIVLSIISLARQVL
jgi:hypothetical protein